MATSVVSISNLALQKLGAARIVSMTEDTKNARECNGCYETLRDRELRAHGWNFAIKRTTLAPSATTPDHQFTYAYPLPADCLRVLKPQYWRDLDWSVESHLGEPAILTNSGTSLEVKYIWQVTDPTQFDALFVDMLACKMAWNMCEALTQSNTKKTDVMNEYEHAKREARKINAFEQISAEPPSDTWVYSRFPGSGIGRNDLRFGA